MEQQGDGSGKNITSVQKKRRPGEFKSWTTCMRENKLETTVFEHLKIATGKKMQQLFPRPSSFTSYVDVKREQTVYANTQWLVALSAAP